MAWNRNHAARLLDGPERAVFDASLPDRATNLSDPELRASVQRLRSQREKIAGSGEPKGQMLDEALLRLEKEKAKREKAAQVSQAAPRAGRTGGMGTRAERPSEGENRVTPQVKPGRSTKAPSPAAGSTRGAASQGERAGRRGARVR